MLDWRAFTSSAICLCALAACHQNKIVHIEVFENYVAVEGVRSNLPIQQACIPRRFRPAAAPATDAACAQ